MYETRKEEKVRAMDKKIDFVLTLSLLFALWYGGMESYTWYMQGIYIINEPIYLLGVFQKIIALFAFGFGFLWLFSSLEKKVGMATLIFSGLSTVLMKDVLNCLFYLVNLSSACMYISAFNLYGVLGYLLPVFDNFIFGIPFMLASYMVAKELVE